MLITSVRSYTPVSRIVEPDKIIIPTPQDIAELEQAGLLHIGPRPYQGVPADSPLWSGPTPDGITRIDYPDGAQKLVGTDIKGAPVLQFKRGDNVWWSVDVHRLSRAMLAAAQPLVQGPSTPGSHGVACYHGADVHVTVFGGSTVVLSQSPLPDGIVANMAQTIRDAPPTTFARSILFVLDSTGEVFSQGETGDAGAFTDHRTGQIFFQKKALEQLDSCRQVMFHEAGHVLDDVAGAGHPLTQGHPLFGHGELVMREPGLVDPMQSGYFSAYASSNAREDFAETHATLLEVRRKYNEQHPGEELFNLADPTARLQMSSMLRAKMAAVVAAYRVVGTGFPGPPQEIDASGR